jgi:hypothetical protein
MIFVEQVEHPIERRSVDAYRGVFGGVLELGK